MVEPPAPVLVYDRIAANRRATNVLLTLFAVLLLPFMGALIPFLMPVVSFTLLPWALGQARSETMMRTDPMTFTASGLAVALIIAVAASVIAMRLEFAQAGRLVLRMTRAHQLRRDDEPDLWRTVENLCIGAGLPAPRLHVIESAAPNAFATGPDPGRASIAFTRGLLKLLNRRELQGVIAHELSHIGNQDTRLNTVLAAVLATLRLPLKLLLRLNPVLGVGCLALSALLLVMSALSVVGIIAEVAIAVWFFSSEIRQTLWGSDLKDMMMFGFVMFYGLVFAVSPFYLLLGAQLSGLVVRRAVSRQREFLADADAILLTRDPEALALALTKIGAAGGGIPTKADPSTAHLYIADPGVATGRWWDKTLSSHPSIEERVALLARMGSGVSPSALHAAHEAGARFRGRPTEVVDARPLAADSGAVVEDARAPSVRPERDEETAPDPKLTDPAPRAPTAVSYLRLTGTVTPLYTAPDPASPVQQEIGNGAIVTLLGVEREFFRVSIGDTHGYIPRSAPVAWDPD